MKNKYGQLGQWLDEHDPMANAPKASDYETGCYVGAMEVLGKMGYSVAKVLCGKSSIHLVTKERIRSVDVVARRSEDLFDFAKEK